jgi:hypothetical protein
VSDTDELIYERRRQAMVKNVGEHLATTSNALNVGGLLGWGNLSCCGWDSTILLIPLGVASSGFVASVLISCPIYARWMATYVMLWAQASSRR